MNKLTAASRLIDLSARFEPIEIAVDAMPHTDADMGELFVKFDRQHLVSSANALVEELGRALAEEGWRPDKESFQHDEDERWTFGALMTLKGRRRSIHYGFLDPVRSIPIVDRVPPLVALYLITMSDGDDYLKREMHTHFGWHYHYLDRFKRRSDVILCWDTRWAPPTQPSTPPDLRGLFVEKHAEGGKPFTARPSAWSGTKRRSMYDACASDLNTRTIQEYRCAANKSEPVHPPAAQLTPHHTITEARKKMTTRGAKR